MSSKDSPKELSAVLNQILQEGSFSMVILADHQGFLVASAVGTLLDAEKQSATVALVQRMTSQVQGQLGMAETAEVSFAAADGQRLICRPFDISGNVLILAVMVPDKDQGYRRLMNKAVRVIRGMWKSRWE